MTLRIVPTPLSPAVEPPSPREGQFDPALADAILDSQARPAALERLRQPGAVAVTTGQQPGLLTGPLYTIYKALSSAALARVLERQWQRPVVPVFWTAGDDHDFAEASEASWIRTDGTVRTVTLPARASDAPLTPMYRELLGPGIEDVLSTLAEDLPPSEFRDSTLEWLRRHYPAEATVAGSFAGALAELIAPAGVVVLDSTHATAKRAASRHLVRALGLARELDRDLQDRLEELRLLGVAPGVPVGDGATLVMFEGAQGRDRLVLQDGRYVTRRSREEFDLETLQAIAAETPGRLSPNVLLRPVIESALLPTVAYIGGPGEMAYLPLSAPIYQRMRITRQHVVPRWSGVLVEPRADRVLTKFNLDITHLLQPPGVLESRLIRSQLPDAAVRALASLRSAIQSGYDALAESAGEIDPTLIRAVQSARNQALAGTQDTEKKLIQHLKRRQETELGQIARARALILPNNEPQERVLTIAPFLARYGPGLISELSDAMESWYASALEGALNPS